MKSSRDVAISCVGHFLIALAAVVLLGGTAHYFGLSGHVVFAFVVVAIFLASVLIPDQENNRNRDDIKSSDEPKSDKRRRKQDKLTATFLNIGLITI